MTTLTTRSAAFLLALFLLTPTVRADELVVPAFTAYMLPNPESARNSEPSGVTRWTDDRQTVNWYGQFETPGTLNVVVEVGGSIIEQLRFRVTIGEQSRDAVAVNPPDGGAESVLVDFGEFTIPAAGYRRIRLEAIANPPGKCGDIKALHLTGPATKDAHFNLKERRNAASVHLFYPTDKDKPIAAMHCEVTAIEDPIHTFYMACGWHRGYFGMQVNSPTERRIIFSVWDSGSEAVDRGKVAADNRVQLVAKGDGVYSGDFGNEGTGGHSHLKYRWKTGEPQRFVVTAQPVEETFTIFSGYYLHPDSHEWMLISSWKAPREGGYLRGLHSFSENFVGSNGHLPRKALFGNQWIQSPDKTWTELTTASFSHDPTGKSDRLDRFMGVEDGKFFLSHGGFIDGFTKYGEEFQRPATNSAPDDIALPAIP